MSEQNKSLVRHILTALGFVLGIIGLNKYTGVVNLLIDNLDAVWSAILVLVGVVTSIVGFFKNSDRFTLLRLARAANLKA